jgi:hypothetical protein
MAKKTVWFDAVSEKVAKTAFHIAGYYPVYLACKINAQSAASQGEVWAQVAVCSTILAAVLFEVAVRLLFRRKYAGSVAAVVGIIPFFAMNMVSASGNVASADVHAREVRQTQARISANLQENRADAVERRKLHDKGAMGETVTSAEAKIKEAISKSATAWEASGHCKAENITFAKTKAFCGVVADLEAKREHAREADKARDDIARIDGAPQAEIAMQSTAEGAGANVAAFAAVLGYESVNGDKVFEWGRGGVLEALATFSPGARRRRPCLSRSHGGASSFPASQSSSVKRRTIMSSPSLPDRRASFIGATSSQAMIRRQGFQPAQCRAAMLQTARVTA